MKYYKKSNPYSFKSFPHKIDIVCMLIIMMKIPFLKSENEQKMRKETKIEEKHKMLFILM